MSAPVRAGSSVPPALRDIQAPVRDRLSDVSTELRRIVTAELPLIAEVNAHLLQMQGKMFRPTLTLLSSAVTGTSGPFATTVAAVIELLHLATLVHDDAVDHSALRRGMPTVNSMFSHQISVLMGDYLYTRAIATLVQAGEYEPLRILTDVSTQMTVGEIAQLSTFEALDYREEDYDRLIRRKTASLISGACEAGALYGAAEHRRALARYGERLGMAFQVADDLLDYTETSTTTGKPSGLDLREHKVTLPLIAALRVMPASARALVETLFSSPEPDDASIAEVVGIVAEYGGIDYARRRGEQFAGEAEEALGSVPDSEARAALHDAITYVMNRRW